MFRLSLALAGGIVCLAGTSPAQVMSNASLKGTYNFRYLGVNAGGTSDVALSYQGTVTFDGTTNANGYGTFTVSGQGASATTGAPTLNVYQVLSSGLFYMTNPFDPTNSTTGINTFLSGAIGTGAIVASSTDTFYCDLLVGVPVATSASSATLSGNYWIASMDFPGGNFAQTRDTFFSLAADGKGGLGNVTIKGTALNLGSTTPQVQTSTGATYTVSANGTGTMTFPAPSGLAAASQLLAGSKSLLISPDGSFFVAGGASSYDMIVGVKALTGSPTGVANGLYFVSYLENFINTDGSFTVYGAVGAASEVGSLGVEIGHQRDNPDYTYSYDDTYGVPFAPAADGTVTYSQSQYVVGAGGNFIIGSGATSNYQVTVYVKAPTLSGTGVFLNPQGIQNNASNVPFTAGVSPGEFLSLYGSGLASQTTTASALPFPTTLGGVQVTASWINDTGATQTAQAPIYYVSPSLIIILVPYTTPGDGSFLNFQVTNGAASNVATVYSGPTSPGIFTIPPGGIGIGAIEHSNFSVVSAASPAKVGETVLIYLTGMGAVTPAVATGAAAASSPLSQTPVLPDVYIDGVLATTVFSGLTPGAAGLYQLNVTIPTGVTTGATVTIEIDTFDSSNDLLSVNVQATIPISQ